MHSASSHTFSQGAGRGRALGLADGRPSLEPGGRVPGGPRFQPCLEVCVTVNGVPLQASSDPPNTRDWEGLDRLGQHSTLPFTLTLRMKQPTRGAGLRPQQARRKGNWPRPSPPAQRHMVAVQRGGLQAVQEPPHDLRTCNPSNRKVRQKDPPGDFPQSSPSGICHPQPDLASVLHHLSPRLCSVSHGPV